MKYILILTPATGMILNDMIYGNHIIPSRDPRHGSVVENIALGTMYFDVYTPQGNFGAV